MLFFDGRGKIAVYVTSREQSFSIFQCDRERSPLAGTKFPISHCTVLWYSTVASR